MQSDKFTGILRLNEPLAKYTTWRIGGVAKRYYRPSDTDDLINFLQNLNTDEPILWLGLGSNVLISDAGFAGTVIHTAKMQSNIRQISDTQIEVEAGVSCAKIAKFAAKAKMQGAEFFAGIPGTMGGALAMNAGAFGGETWEHVSSVSIINKKGEVNIRDRDEFKVGYRSVIGTEGEWFLSANLKFKPGAGLAKEDISRLLQRRNASQPIGVPSCGSVFRNPCGKYAAELIEASKLKGRRVGGAEVSTKHANFIVNVDNASAQDVIRLIKEIKQQVLLDHKVELQPEVKLIGEDLCLEK